VIPATEREKALAALGQLSKWRADGRETWLKVGMALHSVSPDLLPAWDSWSQSSAKYTPRECARQWRSFKPNGGISLGTLIAWAQHDSGALPAPKARPPRPAPAEKAKTVYSTLAAAIQAQARIIGGKVAWTRRYPGPHSFHVVRFDLPTIDAETGKPDKTCRPFHETDGGWVCGDPPGPLPLYGSDDLPAVGDIIVTEGELKADAARRYKLAAVTSAHGSKSAHRSDWTPLRGRTVIVLIDNDRDGRRYGEEVAAILTALGCTVRIVLLPGLPPKGDLVDYIELHPGLEPEELRATIDALAADESPWTPPPEAENPPAENMIRPAFKSLRQLMADYPALRPPVIHGLLRQGETMNAIAASKAGKSWLVTDLALAVTTGRKWLDTFETAAGEVLILDNELHGETIAHRIPRVAEARGIPLPDLLDRLHVESLRGRLMNLNAAPQYFDDIEPGRFKIIVLDAWYRFWPPGTDENDNGTMAGFYNLLDNIANRLGCCFVLVHHASKGGQSGKTVTDVGAGAGAQSRAADTHLILRSHEADDAYVCEAGLRTWPRVLPFCLRWEFPVWNLADDLDPAALRREPSRRRPPKEPEAPPRVWTAGDFVAAFVTATPKPRASIIEAATAAGLSKKRAADLLQAAEGNSQIHRWTYGATVPIGFATIPQPKLDLEGTT